MGSDDLARRLEEVRARVDALAGQMSAPGSGEAIANFERACEEQLELERALAAARGEEHAMPYDLGIEWDVGAPLPRLLTNGRSAFVAFYLNEPDPAWDGTSVRIIDAASEEPAALGLVEFVGCEAVKMGPPNDEVIEGHPLHGKGLDLYEPHVDVNSRWLNELIEINRVHDQFNPQRWETLDHFLFVFHDETVEAIARDTRTSTSHESMGALITRTAARLGD